MAFTDFVTRSIPDPFGRFSDETVTDDADGGAGVIDALRNAWQEQNNNRDVADTYVQRKTPAPAIIEEGWTETYNPQVQQPRKTQNPVNTLVDDIFGYEVGPNKTNRRRDVATVETLLDAHGYHDASKTDGPTGYFSHGLKDSITQYQQDKGLTPDGTLAPKGETINSLSGGLGDLAARCVSSLLGSIFGGIGNAADAVGDAVNGVGNTVSSAAKDVSDTVSGWFGGDDDKPVVTSGTISRSGTVTADLPAKGTVQEKERIYPYKSGDGMLLPDNKNFPPQRGGLNIVMINDQPVPDYKKYVIPKKDWENFNETLSTDPNISDTERKVYSDIFAAEGGMMPDKTGSAKAGITRNNLEAVIKGGQIPSLTAGDKENGSIAPIDLNMQQIKDLYKNYFDNAMAGAAKGHNKANSGDNLNGSDMLQQIGNDKVASAVADTLIRNGTNNGGIYIQKAAQIALPKNQINIDGGYGTQTHKAIEEIATDAAKTKIFLNTLGNLREKDPYFDSGDQARIDYYRF